jgi:hypothetical protein
VGELRYTMKHRAMRPSAPVVIVQTTCGSVMALAKPSLQIDFALIRMVAFSEVEPPMSRSTLGASKGVRL